MSIIPPTTKKIEYGTSKMGYAGELGKGANVNIKFLQTAISREELDNIDLIENIPGSEKWDVRDLFQRTVDQERVGKSILPYLQDENKVKFFNPLTLILLPYNAKNSSVEKELTVLSEVTQDINGHNYKVYEKNGYYRVCSHESEKAFSFLEWNNEKVKVVAIDGQHRLSALKRWKQDPSRSSELADWSIPVVILALFKDKAEGIAPNLLEVVRKTFVYINSTAKEINESRRILLDDESVNCICSQEVIQFAHENDQKDLSELDSTRLPLMIFDWRGEVVNGRAAPGPAALVSVQEVEEWFSHHILGEDYSDEQEVNLNLDDMLPPLMSFGKNKKLTHEDAERVRVQFKKILLPAFNFLMEKFAPYQHYVSLCRQKQAEAEKGDDFAKHAFKKLCFGSHNAGKESFEAVENRYKEIIMDFTQIKNTALDALITRDIGMRSVWSAFGNLKEFKNNFSRNTLDWLEYSKWFVHKLNGVYEDGWFKDHETLKIQQRKILTHIVYDQSGSIINYKHSDVRDAFGSLLVLLIMKGDSNVELQERVWDEFHNNIRKPLRKGFRRYFRGILRDEFEGTSSEFTVEVNKKAESAISKRLKDLQKLLAYVH